MKLPFCFERRVVLLSLLSGVSALPVRAAPPVGTRTLASALVHAARSQIGVTRWYDGAYQALAYPGGDVPLERGVCTDVLVRAYRKLGADLQVLVHEDMRRAWGAYAAQAKRWGLTRPDTNIDHRRVPNLAIFFARHGKSLLPTQEAARFQTGDIVTWRLASGVPHIGLVSDNRSFTGVPLIIHNIGAGAREEHGLFANPVTGHFRYLP
jgi:uncharacterized protein